MKKRLLLIVLIGFTSYFIRAQQCKLLEAHSDTTITCLSPSPCVTLRATVMRGLGVPTNDYQAVRPSGLCDAPPPSNGGTPTYITDDDKWSGVINLPFTFMYFGHPYNKILIGANGVISFDLNNSNPVQQPNGYCAWEFNQSAPSPSLFHNTIFGAYHDVDVRYGGTIKYYVSGTAPNRIFVVDYDNVAQYQCNSLHTSQRVLLYESVNVIDVQIIDKPVCSSWNHGNALIALQNEDGTVAIVPPGRNTGDWAAHDELWRFYPNGGSSGGGGSGSGGSGSGGNYTLTWYDMNNNVLGTGDSLRVCPDTTTSYRVQLDFTINGQTKSTSDTVTVTVDYSHDNVDLGPDQQICLGDTIHLDASVQNATAYHWYKDGTPIAGATSATYDVTQPGQYVADVEIGICSTSDTINVEYFDYPRIDLGPDITACSNESVTLDATPSNVHGNETYVWEKDGNTISGATSPTLDVTETGTYVATVTNNVCSNSDTIHVEIQQAPPLDLGPDQTVCSYETARVEANITDGDQYHWTINGTPAGNSTDPYVEFSGTGQYDVHLTMDKGVCTVEDSVHVTILEPLQIDPHPIIYGELVVDVSGGLPQYYYAINDGDYQTDNHFYNLPDGDYTVHVKDSNDCEGEAQTHVINLIFPKFFSPNNDGRNDTWRVVNSENTPDAELFIYDRYGRLIKYMHTSSDESWDGTFNGIPASSTDYWYVLKLKNGKTYKGHFTLIR